MKKLLGPSALTKAILLVVLTLLAALPLAQIAGLIDERGASRQAAANELAARHAGPQVVTGPFLVLPYTERWTEVQLDEKGVVKSRTEQSRQRVHLVFPERTDLRGKLGAQERYLGIFTVLFYDLQGSMSGRFPAFDPTALPQHEKGSTLEPQPPVLAFATSDLRGLQGAPGLTLAGAAGRWQPRVPGIPASSWLSHGIHAPLPEAAAKAIAQRQPLDFRLDLQLVGQERLAIVPLADENTAHLASDWPHPSFGGKFLATRRTVDAQGFQADWSVSSLVSAARSQLLQSMFAQNASPSALESFDVSLIEPLNVYALTKRAVKYGLLFVALVLMAAFMFELFARLRLHPVQYALVGLSITLFFLLLLALSEKVAFGIAYACGAGASTLLLVVYFSAVLQGWKRGLGLGVYVGVLYAALYGLLSSEDNALLLGSMLLFGLLGVLMIGTRKVDWYALSARDETRAAPASA
ncbi:cell envelope integrity protein CreD [Ramlibacter sp. USB13]|uniref:Cell envelope integrity protein CreD n=1 Tax=Ramlibacter cellulosilyticus TaxID=2764187 RepID=A0A923MRH8_9BURK|nr:cell envelope integrity protein CreD [Ramlibacter cellulosilyticus]MBC5782497.1 cell envelope integrity protein CreD [Ramlibacter cellulosilyticus]